MLKTKLLHPEILGALASAGHGSKILIADGNFPFGSGANPAAKRVYLNLAPGLVNVTEVLRVLVEVMTIEAAEVMVPDSGPEPAIFAEFRSSLPGLDLKKIGRFDFYEAARERETVLVIATGEQRIYANLLLTTGVVAPQESAA